MSIEQYLMAQEEIEKLKQNGFGALVEAMLDPACYTKGGRINASKMARHMKVSQPTVPKMLKAARELLENHQEQQ